MTNTRKRIALITGASKGLGKALATVLADRGWTLLLTARGADSLSEVADALGAQHLAGDVADPEHRARLAAEVARLGGLDLLVNNAGSLGPTPLPRVADFPLRDLSDMFDVNVVAPTALIQATLPALRERRGAVVNISSDAATGDYEGWSGYGATKAALDQVSNVLSAEESDVRVWWVDPGEMRTDMLADAAGHEEASAAPLPDEFAAPAIAGLLDDRPASGRYLAHQLHLEGATT